MSVQYHTAIFLIGLLGFSCASPEAHQMNDGDPSTAENAKATCATGAENEANWAPAFDAEAEGAFLSVWGHTQNDVWTVGGPDMNTGVAWHFDGSSWTRANIADGPLLNWVHGADDIMWMVGNQGRILRRRGAGDFERVDAGESQNLWGVWAASADEAWAVGGDPLSQGQPDPVILHWSNESWRRVPIPKTDRSFRALFKVWGTSASNVFAIGASGMILHYDGREWRQQESGTRADLISLWGRNPSDIMAVGGRSTGIIARYDGQSWTSRELNGEPGLNGVWMDKAGNATVVGARGRILHFYQGCAPYRREFSANRRLLHGVFSIAGRIRFAVGGTLDRNPPWQGVAIDDGAAAIAP